MNVSAKVKGRLRCKTGFPCAWYATLILLMPVVGFCAETNQASSKWTSLAEAATAGSAQAQCDLGYHYEYPEEDYSKPNRSAPRNMPEAVRWYRLSAEQGWARGQYHLGLCLVEGVGVQQDEAQGLEWIRKAADEGHGDAMGELAELYTRGIGKPRNRADEPLHILERVVNAGRSPDSENWSLITDSYGEIVFRYCVGLGVERDLPAAAEWYGRGTFAGAFSLQDKVEYVPGKPRSEGEAFTSDPEGGHVAMVLWQNDPRNELLFPVLSLYLKASGPKGAEAARQIGEMYFTGKDAPRNPVKAWAWLTFAAQRGSEAAHSRISELESHMTGDDKAEAQRRLSSLEQELDAVAAVLNRKTE